MRLGFAIFFMTIGLAMTLGILLFGLVSMVRGGDFNVRWGNRLMRWRIVSQACAIALFGLGVYLLREG